MSKRNSVFQSFEEADKRKILYCIENWDNLPLREESRKVNEETRLMPSVVMNEYVRSSNTNIRTVKYNYSKNGIGRLYAFRGRSLQGFPREIRHTISKEFYYDIDIKNAHPTFLLQYCERNDIQCRYLKDYITNRDTRIQEVIDAVPDTNREKIKKGVLALTNGGNGLFTQSVMSIAPKWVEDYKYEMERIHNVIMEREPMYAKLGVRNATEKKKKGGYYNPQGSAINLMLCEIENTILMSMISCLREMNIDVSSIVLMFDGLMITKKSVLGLNLEIIMRKIEEFVVKNTQYVIELDEKPMNDDFDVPDDYVPKMNSTVIDDDENQSSMVFYEMIKNDIRRCGEFIYVRQEGIWIGGEKEAKRVLIDKCLRSNLVKVVNDVIKNYSSKLSGSTAIVDAMMTRIPNSPTFVDDMKDTTRNRLVFKNGYYDFITKQFEKGFDGIDSVIQINRDYPERNDKLIKDIYDKVLYPIWGGNETDGLSDIGVSFLRFIARAISGHTEDKKFATCLGERDCGKGVLCRILDTAYEKYITTFNAENLLCQRVGNGDEAKKLSWTMLLEHTRIAYSNEIKLDEKNALKLDGVMIKKICGGGDDNISGRRNFENERSIKIGAVPIFFANDFPTITPADTYEKMMPYIFPHKFVDNWTEKSPSYMKKADGDIKRFCSRPEVGNAFIHIVQDYYRCGKDKNGNDLVANMTQGMIDYRCQFNTEDEMDILLKRFSITGNPENFVPSSTVQGFIAGRKMNITAPKIKMVFSNRGARYVVKSINKRSIRGYSGLVDTEDIDKEEDD